MPFARVCHEVSAYDGPRDRHRAIVALLPGRARPASNCRAATTPRVDTRWCSCRAAGDEHAQVELTHNWDPESYGGGRNFGHLAYAVDDIYATCERLMKHGVTINRPPRDGRMAFVRSPDEISVELLQQGASLAAGRALGEHAEYRRLVAAARCGFPRTSSEASGGLISTLVREAMCSPVIISSYACPGPTIG